jgi:hypothetical protein
VSVRELVVLGTASQAPVFDGDLVVAADLTRVPVPPRRAA